MGTVVYLGYLATGTELHLVGAVSGFWDAYPRRCFAWPWTVAFRLIGPGVDSNLCGLRVLWG